MKINNKILIFTLAISFVFLSGCSLLNSPPPNLEDRPTVSDIQESGEYLLGDEKGNLILFDSSNNAISTYAITSNKKSDFLYTVDNGSVYASELVSKAEDGQVLYALDKGNNKVYMLSVKEDKIKEIADKSIKDSDVSSIYAYNGTLFYSVLSEKRAANKYTYLKVESEKYNGMIDYTSTLPEPLPSKLKTYITSINFIEEYIEVMGFKRLSDYSKSNVMTAPEGKTQTYQIPCEVNSWTTDSENIYFCYNGKMGQYNMAKNQIGLYYGPQYTFDMALEDGFDGSVYFLSNFGEKNSTKSLLFELNQGNMNVKNIIETDNPAGLLISVDKSGYVAVLLKIEGDTYYSVLHIYDINTLKLLSTIPLSYVGDKLETHNGKAYLMNENEDCFLIVDMKGGTIDKLNKVVNNNNYSWILPVNTLKVDKYNYGENGHYVNEDGIEMLADGTLIDNENKRINRFFQKVDEYGRAINEEGTLIDRYNNIVDENGVVIKYIVDENGEFHNSKGALINSKGTQLIEDEEGNMIDPDLIPEEEIRGHYDEKGEFIIDKDYLEKYPDAYEKWNAAN